MRTRCATGLAVLTACLLIAEIVLAHDLKPGLYEVRIETGTALTTETYGLRTTCITRERIERHDPFDLFSAFSTTNCLKLPLHFGSGRVGFDIFCVDGRTDKALARFFTSRDWFVGLIVLTRGSDGRTVRLIERQCGRRIGSCKETPTHAPRD